MPRLIAAIISITFALTTFAQADTVLLMAEEDGCHWCERWHEEIGHIYPKTSEGDVAPLVQYDLHDGTPADIELATRVNFTPTFILVIDGQEAGRIEGYPGEDFFWGLLAELLKASDIPLDKTG